MCGVQNQVSESWADAPKSPLLEGVRVAGLDPTEPTRLELRRRLVGGGRNGRAPSGSHPLFLPCPARPTQQSGLLLLRLAALRLPWKEGS